MPDDFPSHHRDAEVWTTTALFTGVRGRVVLRISPVRGSPK